MSPDEFRARIANLTQWSQGDIRAPHKPLLLLYALARFAEGTERFPYKETEPVLLRLLQDFGPPRKKVQAFSFWRLPTDALWEIEGSENVRLTGSGDWYLTDARRENPIGRFPAEIEAVLRSEPSLIAEATYSLLDAHFEPSYHEDILTAIAFDPDAQASGRRRRRERDPRFREAVLRAYGYRCAVCGFDTRLGSTLIGVDAAHVKWHRAGGPDEVENGLALCALHHRLFDRGAYTLRATSETERLVEVAEGAHGGEGFERWLLDFHRRPIAKPVSETYRVLESFMGWHHREVFRGPARQ